ncbi:type I restriction-modification system DNA methylase subunit [Desulfosalsimonas propionicica]|uniref:Type I restriction-modification system DNA methylase subunit n=1 Tax=Desulfosalsimonas propionicica TaxID=332175 RepID=A0A7W0HL67_9BACT|nr:restriction endonuclease subunit S [Desulfosalsimonas propionicica]MBA2881796.1 type I restriction-modification system DNA methylase subunit [Desulfosalsimonas propionicica]
MITQKNLVQMLKHLGFTKKKQSYIKHFIEHDAYLRVDLEQEEIFYPEDKGIIITDRQICNFSANENFVVLECVHRLLAKGYKPKHMELEPKWKVGHGASGGRADILIKDNKGKSLLIIECKTAGREHARAWRQTLQNGGQLFSYVQQDRSTQFICLYSADFIDGELFFTNHIITLKDNEKLLEEKKHSQPLSYKESGGADELFRAWAETYSKDFATKGIFEDDIPAYEIGKHHFSLKDLKSISSNDIQGKYHEFATILRQHNVSGHENAFDKLVNLFLCKIVDEANNPDNLKFYWKGIAYDSHFDLQDRLQLLYKAGMKEFLGEEVTYIDNAAIDDAFRFFKNDPDATRDTIKQYFRELKFYTNNDFAFIDVHNEKLFYQNAEVLLKIVRMLQDIHLKTDEQNQFLGDMFEGFLDQGIKQSEGQFFTPMPIVKFILSSLPVEKLIIEHEQPPNVIDYACGAGHFLNEYAMRIAPVVKQKKTDPLQNYYAAVRGVEKEYRLSKVAKVSAFMYGQNDIDIIYNDALSDNDKAKDACFSLLVSNPPYSVKGFLETLSPSDRERFELTKCVDEKSYASNNSIETFFLERAKQLLKPDGVAGIILPISILSKGSIRATAKKRNIYVTAREILLKYFDIVAITEFGSGTFGKTGTHTITLFLHRRKEDPAPALHYKNRIESWFSGYDDKSVVFKDEHFLRKYCNLLEYQLDDYKSLLKGYPNKTLLDTDVFKAYRKDFENFAETKYRKKQKTFKNLSKKDQQDEMEGKFITYIQNIEKEKLYYFILTSLNPTQTVIVRSPSSNAEMKKFLGYEWSSAKGNEGIKYLGGQTVTIEKDEEGEEVLEQDDKRVLENLLNLDNIQTPLYDPGNLSNPEKINSLIRANFNGETVHIPEELNDYVTTAWLTDMLDFSRKEFNKAISLTPKKASMVESKWELVKLDEIAEIVSGGTPNTSTSTYWENGDICWASLVDTKKKYLTDTERKITKEGLENSSAKLLPVNSVLFSSRATIGEISINKVPTATNQGFKNFVCKGDKIHYEYLYEVLAYCTEKIQNLVDSGTKYKEVNTTAIKNFKIPLPPFEVQGQIVTECKEVDKEAKQAQEEIGRAEAGIEEILSDWLDKGYFIKKIEEISVTNPSKKEISDIGDEVIVSFVEMSSLGKGFIAHKEDRPLNDLRKGTYTYFREEDIIIAKITPCMENGKCAVAKGLARGIGFGSTEFHVIRTDQNRALPEYVFAFLNREVVRKQAEAQMTGSSGHRRVPISFYEQFTIPLPGDLETQKTLIRQIQKHKDAIKEAKEILENCEKRKGEILQKYL